MCNVENISKFFTKNVMKVKKNVKGKQLKISLRKKNIKSTKDTSWKKKQKKILRKQNHKWIHFKEKLRPYVELQNRQKALEETTDNKS